MDYLLSWARASVLLFGAVSVVAIVAFIVTALRRSRATPLGRAVATAALDTVLVLSLVAIGIAGLRPGLGLPGGFEQWNLIPFRDLARALDGRPWGLSAAVVGLAGNFLLFVPWGLLFALRFRDRSWRTMLALTLAISLGIELWQALTATGRSSDVTDIVVNTAGGMVGFALGRLLIRPPEVAVTT